MPNRYLMTDVTDSLAARSALVNRTSVLRRLAVLAKPHRVALAGTLLLSLLFEMVALNQEGYANTYYAAAVKSMLLNWHNFFFLAFDPAGFLAVDKPPLGLWIQAASAKVFGFSGFSLLLPQALASVVSVALLYRLVTRAFGHVAGVLAALALAVTPVFVVDGRNNTSDSLLIPVLLAAVWAVLLAIETGRLRWLLVSAVWVGVGFNIKELQAYLILPPLIGAYIVASRHQLWTRLWHLATFAVALLVVSFAWIFAVDATPASSRPYITNSGTNSELSLALGYNGMGRITSSILSHLPPIPFLHERIDLAIVPGISSRIGDPGVLRLFGRLIAEQVSWLLPVALVGLGFLVWRTKWRLPLSAQQISLVVWGIWLVSSVLLFSLARFYHLYYLVMLAPPLAAMVGIGLVGLWREYRSRLPRPGPKPLGAWLLPLAFLGTVMAQVNVLISFGGQSAWPGWIWPIFVVVDLVATAALLAGRTNRFGPRLLHRLESRWWAYGAFATAVTLSLFIAPATWAAVSVAAGDGGVWLPQAGPNAGITPNPEWGSSLEGPGGGAGGALTFSGWQVPRIDPKLLRYLDNPQNRSRYLVATTTSTYASLLILDTGRPVMTLGGYQGWDRILDVSQLVRLVRDRTVRFFLLPAFRNARGKLLMGVFTGPGIEDYRFPRADVRLSKSNNDLAAWVNGHCSRIPVTRYQTEQGVPGMEPAKPGHPPLTSVGWLYDCAHARSLSDASQREGGKQPGRRSG